MNPSKMFVLFSKYSESCKKIMKHVNEPSAAHIRFLCIDRTDVRHMINKSKKLSVTQVPCVILSYPDGRMERFEGVGVDEWILEQITPQPPPDVGEIQPEDIEEEAPSRADQIASQTQPISGNSVLDIPMNAIAKDKNAKSIAEIAAEMANQRDKAMEKSENEKRAMFSRNIKST